MGAYGYANYSNQRTSPTPEQVGEELMAGRPHPAGYGPGSGAIKANPDDQEQGGEEQDELKQAILAMLMRQQGG